MIVGVPTSHIHKHLQNLLFTSFFKQILISSALIHSPILYEKRIDISSNAITNPNNQLIFFTSLNYSDMGNHESLSTIVGSVEKG